MAVLGVLGLALIAAVAARLAADTPGGRAFVAARLEGIPVGRFGRLHIEGLDGDLLSDIKVARVTLADQKGVWLDVRGVQILWRPMDLVDRRVHLSDVAIGHVQLARLPILSEPGPTRPQPVAVTIDRLGLRLETLPAASVARGSFAVAGNLDSERNGALAGALDVKSLLHPGDGANARFDFGGRQRLAVDAHAKEANGGALAGLLGLPANQPFLLDAHAGGLKGDGWLHVRAASGVQTIASADGTWSKTGGRAEGRLSLSASRLTASLMRALGPEVRFAAAGRPAGNGLFGVALIANADNGALTASGLADIAKLRSDRGLSVQAEIKDLRRVVAAAAMGQGSASVRFNGGWADAHLSGNAVVERFTLGGYGLARVAGPIDLGHANGAWRLRLDATGQGGQGAGLVGALIGGRPHASLDATRLGDGRILIQSMKAQGPGLSLDASGEKGLFGDLSFKGDLKLSNLAAAHAGASGLIDAHWSAAQPRGSRAWNIDLTAEGARFGSGFAELDRLIGPEPRLVGQASYLNGDLLIAKADLAGAAANLHAAGPIAHDGGLKLALQWSARGPFAVGPLQIAGQAQGTGAISGALASPRADLIADFTQIDLPDLSLRPAHMVASLVRGPNQVDGAIALTASSDYGPAHAKAGFRFLGDGLVLDGIDAAGGGVVIAGDLTLTRSVPSVAALTVDAGPGAFLSQGHANATLKIVDAPGGPNLSLSLKATDAELRGSPLVLTAADISADGPLARAPYKISGDLQWSGTPFHLNGGGVASQVGATYAVSFEGSGRVRQGDFHTLTPALFSFGGPQATARASVALGAGRIDIDASQTGREVQATAKLTGVNVASLDPDFAGKIDADLALSGHDQTLTGTLTAHLADARPRDAQAKLAVTGDVKASLAGDRLDIAATSETQTGGHASVTVSLPAESSAAPFRIAIAETRPVTGRFDIDGEVAPIWDLLFGDERTLGGRVTAHGDIGGTLNAPSVTGHAALAAGAFEDAATGLKLRNLAADADLNQGAVTLNSFQAADAKAGTVSGQGNLSLVKGGQSTLTLNLHGFQLIDNETASAVATGSVVISRDAAGKAALAGELIIDRADISAQNSRTPPGIAHMDVIERNRPATLDLGQPNQVANHGLAVALNVALRSSGNVFVKGLGLDAEMSLNATVTGDTAHPILAGTASVVRGDYQLAGQRFEIDSRSSVRLASSPDAIRLDITATRDDPSLTAIVKISGTAAKPIVTLTSSPSLPNDEVLAQVLFGRSAAQLSPVEAAQLAAAVASLATGGGFDVMGGLGKFAGLDRLALGGDAASGVTVSGGKYIGKNVYLELTGGGRSGASAEVEWRAGHGLAVASQIGGETGAKLSISWRHDYGAATQAAKP